MLKGSCMSTFKQISPIPIEVVWGYKERHAEISTVSTNGTCLKNNEYIQSEQERILEMKVKSPMTLSRVIQYLTPTFLVPTRVKNNIA